VALPGSQLTAMRAEKAADFHAVDRRCHQHAPAQVAGRDRREHSEHRDFARNAGAFEPFQVAKLRGVARELVRIDRRDSAPRHGLQPCAQCQVQSPFSSLHAPTTGHEQSGHVVGGSGAPSASTNKSARLIGGTSASALAMPKQSRAPKPGLCGRFIRATPSAREPRSLAACATREPACVAVDASGSLWPPTERQARRQCALVSQLKRLARGAHAVCDRNGR